MKQKEVYKTDSNNTIWNPTLRKWDFANSFNTLPSASYFGIIYNDMLLMKQQCYIASNKNAIYAEKMYNEIDYKEIIEYYIINLTLKIN